MTDAGASGPLDVSTLDVWAQRALTHPLVAACRFEPDSMSPRQLLVVLDDTQYPAGVDGARLEVRWFVGGDYSVQYLESRASDVWQCRWDRHPKPDAPRAHFHPPPNAGAATAQSPINAEHHLDVLFGILDWMNTAEQ